MSSFQSLKHKRSNLFKRNREKTQALHAKNFTRWGLDLQPIPSFIVLVLTLLFSFYVFSDPEGTKATLVSLRQSLTSSFDWLFIFGNNLILVVAFIFAFSRFGTIKLGGHDAKANFSFISWASMLLSAGMGIGLMYYGVYEPALHFESSVPFLASDSANTQEAMALTFFHWGVHPWAIYAFVAASLAFFAFNRKLPLSFRSVFYPIIGDRIFGPIGDMIDIISVLACLFGLATSLGLGAIQISEGLNTIFNIPASLTTQVVVIAFITIIATLSVFSGIQKGVRFLSNINMSLAFGLLLFLLIAGPTTYILSLFNASIGEYLSNLITFSTWLPTEPNADPDSWRSGWTVFYWAWWISWCPFVGIFIARISYGRTIRQLILATIFLPSLVSALWFSTLGGTAFYNDLFGGQDIAALKTNLNGSLFALLASLNLPSILFTVVGFVTILLIFVFFITSSDSGSLVVDNLTSGGKLDTPATQRIAWASLEGLIAIALLVVAGSGGLSALQTGVILTALPFLLLLIFSTWSFYKVLKPEYTYTDYKSFENKHNQVIED